MPATVPPPPQPVLPPAPIHTPDRADAPQPAPAGKKSSMSHTTRIAWFMAVSIVGVAILAVLLGRGVELNGEGVKVGAVGSTTSASVEEFEAQQPRLEATLDNQIEELAFEPAAAFAAPDISGSWFTVEGFRYDFFQIGSAVTFQEVSNDGLITGVGEGTISNNTLQFAYTNGFTSGAGELTLDGDGDLLGSVFDNFSGAGVQLFLFR